MLPKYTACKMINEYINDLTLYWVFNTYVFRKSIPSPWVSIEPSLPPRHGKLVHA